MGLHVRDCHVRMAVLVLTWAVGISTSADVLLAFQVSFARVEKELHSNHIQNPNQLGSTLR